MANYHPTIQESTTATVTDGFGIEMKATYMECGEPGATLYVLQPGNLNAYALFSAVLWGVAGERLEAACKAFNDVMAETNAELEAKRNAPAAPASFDHTDLPF